MSQVKTKELFEEELDDRERLGRGGGVFMKVKGRSRRTEKWTGHKV